MLLWAAMFVLCESSEMISTIMFITLDELCMSAVHRRVGPLNLGWYGVSDGKINCKSKMSSTGITMTAICLQVCMAKLIVSTKSV